MQTDTAREPATSPLPQETGEAAHARELPSGRSVLLRVSAAGEEIEVRSAAGEVEVRICLTAEGPVVQLRGARLHLDAAEAVDVRCRRFAVQAADAEFRTAGDIHMEAGGEMRIRTEGETHINGKMINLNC